MLAKGNATLIGRPTTRYSTGGNTTTYVSIDFGNRVQLLQLTQQLTLQRIVLLGAAPVVPSTSDVVPIGVMAFSCWLWAFSFNRTRARVALLYLNNVTILLPSSELAVLEALTKGNSTPIFSDGAAVLRPVYLSAQVVRGS